MVVKQRSLGRRLWLGDLPLVHSKEGWAWVLPAAGCPATSFCVSVVAARARAPAQIFIAPVLAFSPPHLAISCHHALTRLALSSHICSVTAAHMTRFWVMSLSVTMKLNILLSSSRFGVCKI